MRVMTWYALGLVNSKRSDEIPCLGLSFLIYGSELRSVVGEGFIVYKMMVGCIFRCIFDLF